MNKLLHAPTVRAKEAGSEPLRDLFALPRRRVSSAELYARALQVIPGGVNSPVRAMKAVGLEQPLFAARGEGAYLEDAEGRRYLDWVLSWGPLIFGHADPETVEAVVAAARDGTTFGTATEREVELAEEIVDAVPSVEMVRLVSSGTEAAMTALRLARAATGREPFVRFRGNYHGHADPFLSEAGSGVRDARRSRPRGEGRVVDYNDLEAVEARSTARPASSSSRWPGTWASSRRPRASSRACAGSATRAARCSSSTR